jgi:hypothetical protein
LRAETAGQVETIVERVEALLEAGVGREVGGQPMIYLRYDPSPPSPLRCAHPSSTDTPAAQLTNTTPPN